MKSVFLAISYTKRQKVEKAITKFFEDKGFTVKTGRDIRSGMPIGDEIIRIIESCNFGIVVYNELRHNISYEWGLMDAILGKMGHIFLFKDENIHIDLVNELSDKNNINFTSFYGEDSEEEIIKSLESNSGLIEMVKECIGETISNERTPEVSDLADTIISSDIPLKKLQAESKEIKVQSKIKKEDARNLEEKFESINNLTVDGHFYKSSAHYYAGQYEKAKEEIRKVIELDPDNSAAHCNYGVILSELGKDKEAEVEFRLSLTLDPENAQTYGNLGIILSKLERNNESELQFREAISLEPENGLFYALLGSQLTKLGYYDEAEIELRKSISINPEIPMAHGSLGLLLSRFKRYDEAELEFKEEIRLDPSDAGAHVNLSRLLIQMERYVEAENECRIAINLNPNSSMAYDNLGLIFCGLKRYDDAENAFNKSIELDSTNFVVRRDFGNFLNYLRRYDEAKEEYMAFIDGGA